MIKPVGLPPLMVVKFDLDPMHRGYFDVIYERDFLSPLLKLSPQLRSIKRFETCALTAQVYPINPFWTFYELDCEDTLTRTDEIFANPEFSENLAIFRYHKERILNNFSRVNYEPLYNYTRMKAGPGLSGSADGWRRIEQFDLAPERREEFFEWYLGQYQNDIQECTPDLAAYHIFQVCGSTPGSVLSVFQSPLIETLEESLELLRSKKLGQASPQWQQFCSDGTVVNLECSALSNFLILP